MMKRLIDITLSLIGLVATSPLLIGSAIVVWVQDWHSPLYIAPRVGKDETEFSMVKLRSMVIGASKSGVDSTSSDDNRITRVGAFIRKFKLDELMQLWNVLIGDMSLVGPRPNVKRETDLYTPIEKKLLATRPGITDLASIVFSDEGEVLKDHADPDLAYNQLIRPWKSRLALLSVENSSILLDLKTMYLTAVAIVSRERALIGVQQVLHKINAEEDVCRVALRHDTLEPSIPPGATEVVQAR